MTPSFADFTASLPTDPAQLARGLIGKELHVGNVPMLYADYIASGRALAQVEDFMRDQVLPYYANTHTEDSLCGAVMTQMREAARAQIAKSCGAGSEHAVVFTGSGATSAVNRLVHLLGARRRWRRRVTVLIGPYEHHSNILPWREAGADVREVPEAPGGGVDLDALEALLGRARGPVIGAFSAMSNVSGQLSDVEEVTRRIKRVGGLVVWDYAGGGPYLPIQMSPAPDAQIDAIVLSPHKFVGGPGASGAMIVRQDAVKSAIPSQPGGGTVWFVSSQGQDYLSDISAREEGGTPNVVGDIRAGMVFAVKDALGADWIYRRNLELTERLQQAFVNVPRLMLLGAEGRNRMPILSFRVRRGDDFHNFRLATRVLSDHFGIQARGGCACAGPYVLRLLGVNARGAAQMRARLARGEMAFKPGFVRLNLSHLMSEDDIERVISAVKALPETLDNCADAYLCDDKGAYRPKSELMAAQ